GAHPNPSARGVLGVRPGPHRCARRERAPHPRQCCTPHHDQVPTLALDIALPLRDFELRVALAVSGTVALVGPSGAGKTSVLRAIAGLVRARGRIALDEQVWL